MELAAGGVAAGVVPRLRAPIASFLHAVESLPQAISIAAATRSCSCAKLPLQPLWGATPDLFDTYWGSFGWETFHLPSLFYPAFVFFSLVSTVGVAMAIIRRAKRMSTCRRLDLHAFAAILASFLLLLGVVLYRNLITQSDGGTTHARFIMPEIVGSSAFLAVGFWALPKVPRILALSGFFSCCLSALGFAIWTLPHAFVDVPAYGDIGSAGGAAVSGVDYANGMRIAGINLPGGPVRAGDSLTLMLFWATSHQPDFDYSAFVRLNNGQGSIIHDNDHGPGAPVGLLPHEWQAGEVIPDRWTVAIPSSAPPGEYAVEVGVYDYRDLKSILALDGQPAAVVAVLHVTGRS